MMVCVVRSEIPLRYENGRNPDRKPLLEQASHMELVRKLGEALQISSIMQVSQTLKITVNKMNTTFQCGRQLYRSYFLAPFPKNHRHPPTSSIYQGASVLCMLQEPLGNTLDHAVLTQLPQGLRPRFQVASTCHRCDAFSERIWTQTIPYKYHQISILASGNPTGPQRHNTLSDPPTEYPCFCLSLLQMQSNTESHLTSPQSSPRLL